MPWVFLVWCVVLTELLSLGMIAHASQRKAAPAKSGPITLPLLFARLRNGGGPLLFMTYTCTHCGGLEVIAND